MSRSNARPSTPSLRFAVLLLEACHRHSLRCAAPAPLREPGAKSTSRAVRWRVGLLPTASLFRKNPQRCSSRAAPRRFSHSRIASFCVSKWPRLCISRKRGLTPRSSGAPTAGRQARSGGTRYIFASPGLAPCRRRPLSSNVRHPNSRHCRPAVLPAPLPYTTLFRSLLVGGDKSSQKQDIAKALELNRKFQE